MSHLLHQIYDMQQKEGLVELFVFPKRYSCSVILRSDIATLNKRANPAVLNFRILLMQFYTVPNSILKSCVALGAISKTLQMVLQVLRL